MLKIGIIVPFYKGYEYLDKLVSSLDKAAAGLSCTLYIIDNSPENIPVRIPAQEYLSVEVIREKPGIGYGKACNKGYELSKVAGMDYIVVVNQDGYVSENLIHSLVAPFEKDSRIMITAPLLKKYDDDQFEDFFIKYYFCQTPELVSDKFSGHLKEYYEMSSISGACFAFNLNNKRYRYSYFFDPLYHMYSEDEDLCMRLRFINTKIVMVTGDAIFYHRHSDTTETETRDHIDFSKLVSEKLLRLKDIRKPALRVLFGIFITTFTSCAYHLLRGEFKSFFLHFRSLFVILFRMPAIVRTRRADISVVNAQPQQKKQKPEIVHE